jgi:hypothetical protein
MEGVTRRKRTFIIPIPPGEEVRWNGREKTLDLVLDETSISQAWNRLETGRADEDRGTSCSEEQTV